MAFWRIGNNFANTSNIDQLLDKPDHTLAEFFEDPDLLPELVAPNTKLVEYLREPEILQQLVRLITEAENDAEGQTDSSATPLNDNDTNEAQDNSVKQNGHDNDSKTDDDNDSSFEADDNNEDFSNETTPNNDNLDEENDDDNRSDFDAEDTRKRYANIAAEILGADVWSITEALMESTELIDEIWGLLDLPTPLSMDNATHFTKINEHLLDKKTDEMLVFIKAQDNFVERFMKHIDNPPLMDFLLKVISSDKPDNPTGIIQHLQSQKFIPSLISFLDPKVLPSVQSAAGDFLKAFVTISANSNSDNTTIGPNELSRELVSEPCVRELVRLMLFGGSGLATSVGVVIEIIRKNNSDYDFVPVMYLTIDLHPPTSRDPIYLGTLVKIFAENLPKFNEMLTRKHDEVLKTPFGQIEPLGFERFKICELVAELLHCSNMALLNDAGGEAIVAARDAERIRVLSLENQEESGDTSFEAKTELTEAATDPIPEEDEKDEVKSLEEDLSSLSLERPEEENAEAEEGTAVPSEASLRVNPVVGDLLKITLADTQVITHILNMFFQFPWNNFLHNVVFDIVQQVLNGSMTEGYNRYLAIDLFDSGRLTHLICEGYENCLKYQEKTKNRLGYMGHLTLISEEVVKFTAVYTPESISPVVEKVIDDPEWGRYVSEILAHTRDQYNSILGGPRSDDDQDEGNPDDDLMGSPQPVYDDDDPSQDQELEGDDWAESGNYDESETLESHDPQDGSSDEEEEADLEPAEPRKEARVQLLGSDFNDEDEDEDDSGLDLVRSKNLH